jgi:acetylornithine deacetylase/succinyl-diaminopimelate desuccinylase-like protein
VGYRTQRLFTRAEHGKIHGVDERIPLAGIAEMTEIVYALVERWNAAR